MRSRPRKTKQAVETVEPIDPVIRVIRGRRVIVDADLAGDIWSDHGSPKLAKKLDDLERKWTGRLDAHEKAIVELFTQIRRLLRLPPPQPKPKRKRMGF